MSRLDEIRSRLQAATPDGRAWYLVVQGQEEFHDAAPSDIAWLVEQVEQMRDALEYVGRWCKRESPSDPCTCVPHAAIARLAGGK